MRLCGFFLSFIHLEPLATPWISHYSQGQIIIGAVSWDPSTPLYSILCGFHWYKHTKWGVIVPYHVLQTVFQSEASSFLFAFRLANGEASERVIMSQVITRSVNPINSGTHTCQTAGAAGTRSRVGPYQSCIASSLVDDDTTEDNVTSFLISLLVASSGVL